MDIKRPTILAGTVRRGPMVVAETEGRVASIAILPGVRVSQDTVVLDPQPD
jgi:hypothetical protein